MIWVFQVIPINPNHLNTYALFKTPGRNKLQEKAEYYVLVGYGDTTGTYRLLDPKTRKVLITRDVVFNEEGFICKRYLPHYAYFSMEGEMGVSDFAPPICEFKQPPLFDETPLNNIPPNGDEDDDSYSPPRGKLPYLTRRHQNLFLRGSLKCWYQGLKPHHLQGLGRITTPEFLCG